MRTSGGAGMRKATCFNCAAFDMYKTELGLKPTVGAGLCRRKSANHDGVWPSLNSDNWCLEHVPLGQVPGSLTSNHLVQKPS